MAVKSKSLSSLCDLQNIPEICIDMGDMQHDVDASQSLNDIALEIFKCESMRNCSLNDIHLMTFIDS